MRLILFSCLRSGAHSNRLLGAEPPRPSAA